jgi:integrase
MIGDARQAGHGPLSLIDVISCQHDAQPSARVGGGGIGHISAHAFRHTYRWLDAVKTPIAVQQKMMRHTDIRTTMNVYGAVVTDEMSTASVKVAALAFRPEGAQAERESR